MNTKNTLNAFGTLAAAFIVAIGVQQEIRECHVQALDDPAILETNLFCNLNL